MLSLLVGGIPLVIGLGFFFWGRWLLRRARAERALSDRDLGDVYK
jgi:hypothetical protein